MVEQLRNVDDSQDETSSVPDKVPPMQRDTRFYQLFSDHDDVVSHEGIHEYLTSEAKRRHGQTVYSVATDMDGTMFDSDLGIALFCNHAFDASFWTKSDYDFETALRSGDFITGFSKATTLKNKDANYSVGEENDDIYIDDYREVAKWVLSKFVPEIIRLYQTIRFKVHMFGIKDQEDQIRHFIALFYLLHQITIKMESVFNAQNSGKIIPLTRMLAGWTEAEIRKVADPMFSMEQDSPSREFQINNLDLSIFEDATGLTISQNLRDEPVRLRANKVLAIKRFYRQIAELRTGIINIVTTNLPLTAEIAVSSDPYKKMFDLQTANFGLLPRQVIHGSQLAEANGRIYPILDGPAVLAEQKRSRVMLLDLTPNKTMFVAGDTRTDLLMMKEAVRNNGGIGTVVGRHLEETRRRFAHLFTDLNAAERERILWAEQSTVYTHGS